MKELGVFLLLPGWDAPTLTSPVAIYTHQGGLRSRHCESKVSCLGHQCPSLPGLEPSSFYLIIFNLVYNRLLILFLVLNLTFSFVLFTNAVTNFANFTIFRFSFKFNKFCNFSFNSTRYTKIRCLNDFSVCCAEIYNFMLIDQQAPACRFYKIYKIYDFSLTSRFFNKPLQNL